MSFRLNSFASRFLKRLWRTGAISLHTSLRLSPFGFILSL